MISKIVGSDELRFDLIETRAFNSSVVYFTINL